MKSGNCAHRHRTHEVTESRIRRLKNGGPIGEISSWKSPNADGQGWQGEPRAKHRHPSLPSSIMSQMSVKDAVPMPQSKVSCRSVKERGGALPYDTTRGGIGGSAGVAKRLASSNKKSQPPNEEKQPDTPQGTPNMYHLVASRHACTTPPTRRRIMVASPHPCVHHQCTGQCGRECGGGRSARRN